MSDGLYLFTPSSPPPPPPSSSVDTYSKTKTKKADTRERPASTKRDRSGTFIRRSPICVDLTFITEAEMEEEQRQRRQQQQQRRIPSNAKKSKTSPLVNNNNNNNNTTILTGGNGVSSYMCDSSFIRMRSSSSVPRKLYTFRQNYHDQGVGIRQQGPSTQENSHPPYPAS